MMTLDDGVVILGPIWKKKIVVSRPHILKKLERHRHGGLNSKHHMLAQIK